MSDRDNDDQYAASHANESGHNYRGRNKRRSDDCFGRYIWSGRRRLSDWGRK